MTHTPNLFPLKVFVISLGALLAGGIVFVLLAVSGRIATPASGGACPDATVHLNGKASIINIMPQGNIVQLTLESGDARKVLTVDRCTGLPLQTLTILP